MRIALVSNTLPPEGEGGAEAYAADLARELSERHEVLVLTGAQTRLPGIECVEVGGLGPLGQGSAPIRKAVWHLQDLWLPSVHLRVARPLRRWAPDVVHSHAVQGLSAAAFTGIASAGFPHVHTAHDYAALCMRVTLRRGRRRCEGRCLECRPQRLVRGRALARGLDLLVAPSDFTRDVHVRAGLVDARRAMTIRHGTRTGRARLRSRPPRDARLGFIGSLAAIKGVRTLLRAFAQAPPSWRLDVAGSGPLEGEVRAAAAADERIRFAGRVSGRAKDEFFDGLDLLVVPSEWDEPGPLVAVEAAIRGLPSLVSDRGGLPENAEVAIFRAGDPEALLGAARSLLEDEAPLAAASARLLEQRDRFSWTRHVDEIERTLASVALNATR